MTDTPTPKLSLRDFAAFARIKPADLEYEWFSTRKCPGAQFLQSVYPDKLVHFGTNNGSVWPADKTAFDVGDTPEAFPEFEYGELHDEQDAHIISNGGDGWTWGELADRLDAQVARLDALSSPTHSLNPSNTEA